MPLSLPATQSAARRVSASRSLRVEMLGIELNAIRSASASDCCCVTEARAAFRFGILFRTELIWWFPMSMKVLAFVFVQDPQLNA